MKYRESEEMYLETILLLSRQQESVHSIDIANEMKYAKSSVSRGVKLLKENGYLIVHADGKLELTEKGLAKANDVYDRHSALTLLLEGIGAPAGMAEENACRIEHVISADLFEIIKKYVYKK